MTSQDTLTFHPQTACFLAPYLPAVSPTSPTHPFTTLTYAASLDSHLALSPGAQTYLSGPLSKSLTHYLRSRHSAILIGVSTAVADDPGLNCRLLGVDLEGQPRPIIIDPDFRWEFTRDSRVLKTAREGKGKAPYIIANASNTAAVNEERLRWLGEAGGRVFWMPELPSASSPRPSSSSHSRWGWDRILGFIKSECKVDSLMIEGGGVVINSLLSSPENLKLINSVIITIAPVYLGQGGVNVSPAAQTSESGQRVSAVKFKEVQWNVLGNDVVMVARPDV